MMKVINREQARKYTNANISSFEFDLGTKEIDGAIVNFEGRFPENGKAVNKECREFAYVVEGKGRIIIEGNPFEIKNDDLVIIDKGERYYWEGDFKLFVYCTPAWSPEQHKQVD
jgi:mannose-6-phosphate isomerase-like protein (cupin superfamily)